MVGRGRGSVALPSTVVQRGRGVRCPALHRGTEGQVQLELVRDGVHGDPAQHRLRGFVLHRGRRGASLHGGPERL